MQIYIPHSSDKTRMGRQTMASKTTFTFHIVQIKLYPPHGYNGQCVKIYIPHSSDKTLILFIVGGGFAVFTFHIVQIKLYKNPTLCVKLDNLHST